MNTSRMSKMDRSMLSSTGTGGFRQGKNQEDNVVKEWQYISKDVCVLQLACTTGNWFCLSTAGELFSWGQKTECIGRKQTNMDDMRMPTKMTFPHRIMHIATGRNHILALSEKGEVFTWGKNDFGQVTKNDQIILGHGGRAPEPLPKIVYKEQMVQVYAGEDCSFAVSKRGMVFSWGANNHNQVSENDVNCEEVPLPLVQCPWDIMSTRIVYGRDNASYIYTAQFNLFTDKIGNSGGQSLGNSFLPSSLGGNAQPSQSQLYPQSQILKRKDYQIADMTRQIEDLKQQLKDKGHFIDDEKPDSKETSNNANNSDKNDQILKEINQYVNELNKERQDLENKIKNSDTEMKSIEREIAESKRYEDTLVKKDEEFHLKKKQIELQVREIMKEKNRTTDLSSKLAELNRNLTATKEIIESNDDLKNKAIMKQNNSEELKNKAKALNFELSQKKSEVEKKERMFIQLREERKKFLKAAIFDEKKVDLEKWVIIIHSQLKQLKETGMQEMSLRAYKEQSNSKSHAHASVGSFETSYSGIEEISKKSNQKIDKIAKGLKEVKLNPNDPSADIIGKVVDILEDSIQCRKQLNDLTVGILIQASDRQQRFQQEMMRIEAEQEAHMYEDDPENQSGNGNGNGHVGSVGGGGGARGTLFGHQENGVFDEEQRIRQEIMRKYENISSAQFDEFQSMKHFVEMQKIGRENKSLMQMTQNERLKKTQQIEANKKKSGKGLFFF